MGSVRMQVDQDDTDIGRRLRETSGEEMTQSEHGDGGDQVLLGRRNAWGLRPRTGTGVTTLAEECPPRWPRIDRRGAIIRAPAKR